MSLSNGLLNLTSWLGNVIMPTLAGLFAAAAVYQFSKGRHHHQFAAYRFDEPAQGAHVHVGAAFDARHRSARLYHRMNWQPLRG